VIATVLSQKADTQTAMIFDARFTIASNDCSSPKWSDSSFVGILHERHQWDSAAYLVFEASLYDICERRKSDANLREFVDRVVSRVFGYTMLLFACHYDPSDGFVILNLNEDELATWRERFQLVCEGFFGNSMPKPAMLDPINPHIENGRSNHATEATEPSDAPKSPVGREFKS
jgi:hypothetical protein